MFQSQIGADVTETLQNYERFSLVKLPNNEGAIWKEENNANINLITIDQTTTPKTTTSTTLTFIDGGLVQGATALTSLKLLQARDDPATYISGTIPPIYAVMNDVELLRVEVDTAASELTVVESISIPTKYQVTLANRAQHMDLGHTKFVVLSPIDCSDTIIDTDFTANPSARFYDLSTVPDGPDTNGNSLIDSTETTDPVTLITTGDAHDVDKGWTCIDLPATEDAGVDAWDIIP